MLSASASVHGARREVSILVLASFISHHYNCRMLVGTETTSELQLSEPGYQIALRLIGFIERNWTSRTDSFP
jgi:hypothetical protein